MKENIKRYFANAHLYGIFILLAFVTYGWHFGWHNHAALIPAIYHLIDPTVLANDLQAGNFPIYIRALTWLMSQMGHVIPLPVLFLLFQVLSLFLLFYAIRKLAEEILPGQPVFGWFAVLMVIMYRYIVPGDNLIIGSWILFESTFYMYTLGYAVSFLALVYLAKRKTVLAGVVAGLSLYIQLNQGEQIGLLIGGILLLSGGPFKERIRNLIVFGLVSSIIGAPILIPAFREQILNAAQSSTSDAGGLTFYDVLRFRHRHHLQPTAWPMVHHVMFILQIVATALLFKLRKKASWTYVDAVLARAFIVIVVLCGLGYLNEILRVEVIDKSYLFRTSVVLAIITVLYSCWAFWSFLEGRISRETIGKFARYGSIAVAIYAMMAFIIVYRYPSYFEGWRSKIFPGLTFDIQQTPLEKYIQYNTPKDAIFLVSPEYLNFSVNTMRAEVVNWMAIPYNQDMFKVWYERVVDVTGGAVTIESMKNIKDSYAIRDSTGTAFYRMPLDGIRHVAKKYNAQYCVFANTLPIKPEFTWKGMSLYRLQ